MARGAASSGGPSGDAAAVRRGQTAVILSLLYGGYLLSFGDRVIFGLALKPIKAALGFSDSALGLLSGAAFAASYAIFSPLGGWIVDRRPRRAIMAGAITFWSIATAATAFATSFIGMGLARCGVGVGESLLHPLAVSLLGDVVPVERRPRAFATYLSAGAMGTLLAMLLGGLLVGTLTRAGGLALPVVGAVAPWQGLFLAAALPGFLLAVVVLLVMREPERAHRPPTLAVARGEGWRFLRAYPRFAVALYLGISLVQMGAYTLSTWSVLFFDRVHGWSAGEAGIRIGATSGVSILIGCFAAGRLISILRGAGREDAQFLVAILGGIGTAVFGILAMNMPTPVLALAMLALALFWAYFASIAGFSAMGEVLPPAVRARLAGLHTLGNGLVSNSLGPFLVGFLSDRLFPEPAGIRWALTATLALAGVSGVLLVAWGRSELRTLATTVWRGQLR